MSPTGQPLLLFAEDFDEPAEHVAAAVAVAEPEIIDPVYSVSDLAEARAAAAAETRAAVECEQSESHQMHVRLALTDISNAMEGARREAEKLAEAQGTAIAGLLLGVLRANLPAAFASRGAAEARTILDSLRPGLLSEPNVVIQLHPATADALAQDLANLRSALPADVRIAPTVELLPGDLRVTWKNGAAVRDTTALLASLDEILGVDGLMLATKDVRNAG